MREQSWTCRCGADLFVRSPLETNQTLLTVTCPNCGQPRQQLTASPLALYRVGPGGVLFPVQVYGAKPPQRAAAPPPRRHARAAKAAANG